MENYRVFISYARDDKTFVDKIIKILEENGLIPIYDKYIPGGVHFDEDIKKYITQSHIFMPVITEESSKRGWVHEEIGYAMALNIPVLPIVIKEQQPQAMLQMFNAIVIDEELTDAKTKLSYDSFDKLFIKYGPKMSTYLCRAQTEERACLMASYADDVDNLGYKAVLRQKGGLSSFQIPNTDTNDSIWDERYDPVPKNGNRCDCQLMERRALEKHAKGAGCKLIINPSIITAKYFTRRSKIARLSTFLKFLNEITDDKIDVVIDPNLKFNESVTILGDWFAAESYFRPETQGFKHTMFTRHAPGIKSKIKDFDDEFNRLMANSGKKPGETRKYVIDVIEKLLVKVKKRRDRHKLVSFFRNK